MISHLNSLGFNELVAEYTVTGSAATTITFNGLDINADGGYTIVAAVVSTGTGSGSGLFVNNDTTLTNYDRRYIDSTSTTLGTGAVDDSYFCGLSGSSGAVNYAVYDVCLVNGHMCANGLWQTNNTTIGRMHFLTHTVSQTNITRIDITATVSPTIGIGSKIQIYRWKPGSIKTLSALSSSPLVWSYEVTGSAVTTVTATGLDIVRDGSYKIVVVGTNAISSSDGVGLYINTDTTTSNYSGRYILSGGTSLSTSGGSYSSSVFASNTTANQTSFGVANVSLVNGYACINTVLQYGNTAYAQINFAKHNVSQSNITQLVFQAPSGIIGVGSKFYIFRTR